MLYKLCSTHGRTILLTPGTIDSPLSFDDFSTAECTWVQHNDTWRILAISSDVFISMFFATKNSEDIDDMFKNQSNFIP